MLLRSEKRLKLLPRKNEPFTLSNSRRGRKMRMFRGSVVILIAVIPTAGLVLNCGGCSKESFLQALETHTTLSFKSKPGDYAAPYPQSGSYTYHFWSSHNAYRVGNFSIPNNIGFRISWGEFIPSPTSHGEKT